MAAIKFARSAAHPRNFKIASTKSRICCKNFKLNFEIFWCAARRRCGCIFRACGTQNSRRHRSSLLSRRNVWARKTRVRCRDRVNFPRKNSRNRWKYFAFLTRNAPHLQPAPLRTVKTGPKLLAASDARSMGEKLRVRRCTCAKFASTTFESVAAFFRFWRAARHKRE